MKEQQVSIIGAGIVGTAVGKALESRGYKIAAVSARSQASLDRAGSYLNAHETTSVVEAAKLGNLIFITTSDDYIQEACEEIALNGGFDTDDIVFHMSGALSLSVLDAAKSKGAQTGSLHPLQTFATIDAAIDNLPGSVFGVTAHDEALSVAEDIVQVLGGIAVLVNDEDKVVYHAAACVVSNYLVSLVHLGESLYGEIGIPGNIAGKAFKPLLKGTVDNIEKYGAAQSLTGPIARGDIGTVRKHLEALARTAPWALPVYCELGAYTAQVAVEKGSIDKETALKLIEVLKGKDFG